MMVLKVSFYELEVWKVILIVTSSSNSKAGSIC